ncbi:MAG: hypothetical protein LBE20_03915 [Deltaproteobacteria bacterium]|jgi:hypothetical protein|nr:hypothetical protein [Deltaproteobacteria bacterium]
MSDNQENNENSKYLPIIVNTPNYTFRYSDTLSEDEFQKIKKSLDSCYQPYKDFFGVENHAKYRVYIYPSRDEFHDDWYNNKMPENFIGLGGRGFLSFVSPQNCLPTMSYERAWKELVPHELAHTFTFENINFFQSEWHRWFVEGIANYVYFYRTGDVSWYSVEKVRKAIQLLGYIPDLNELGSHNKVNLEVFSKNYGWQFADVAVDYMIKEYSEDIVSKIIKNPDKTPFEVMGITKSNFEIGWKKYIEEIICV